MPFDHAPPSVTRLDLFSKASRRLIDLLLPVHDNNACPILRRDLALEQSVAVLRESRVVPGRGIDADPNEPTEQASPG
jgi:hypothetical protein